MNDEHLVIKVPKKDWSLTERLLLPASLLIGILFDRLIAARFASGLWEFASYAAAFWLCYLAIFTLFYAKRQGWVQWAVALCAVALCVWCLIFEGNAEYKLLSLLVVPAVLMMHAQLASGEYKLKDAGRITAAWFSGWFVQPFSGIPAIVGVSGSLVSGGRRPVLKKVLIGAGIALPLLCVLIPLLSGADRVFGYWTSSIFSNLDFPSVARHVMIILIAAALFFSFLWNAGFSKRAAAEKSAAAPIDTVICCIVLGAVSLLYLLFCGVQFTYLFARSGLPGGMTYATYAREGFAQTVAVCAINLLIFGVFLRYGTDKKPVKSLLAGLLGLTGVMLVSGFVRLGLYIDAFGLTWLRLISAWFIVYLAAVLIICSVRMLKEKLPAIALCALLLLGWYVALGYANPDALVDRYNQTNGYDVVERM